MTLYEPEAYLVVWRNVGRLRRDSKGADSGSDPICTLRPFVLCQHLALPLFDRSLFATLEQPRRFHPLRPGRERRRRTAPAQRLDLFKERRIGSEDREILEEEREIALFAEDV